MEGGAASIVGGLQLSAFLEQALHSLDVAPLGSHMPGCVAIVVGYIQAAPLLTVWGQQELDGITSPTCITTAVLSGTHATLRTPPFTRCKAPCEQSGISKNVMASRARYQAHSSLFRTCSIARKFEHIHVMGFQMEPWHRDGSAALYASEAPRSSLLRLQPWNRTACSITGLSSQRACGDCTSCNVAARSLCCTCYIV